jgi:predicted outer membrane repeat protein
LQQLEQEKKMKSLKIELVFIVVSIISAFVASTSAAQENIGRNKLQPNSYPGASCLPDGSDDPDPYPYPYPDTPSEPASIVVTNTSDAGPGSLRQALNDICAGGAVLFDSPLAGQTIHLSSKLEVNKQVTIYGANLTPNIKISGDTDADGTGDVQIMTIGSSAKVKIMNIDFENGKNETALQAGGINNSGILSIYDSTFSGNTGDTGGAILNSNSIYIENSVFESNYASDGGALHTSEATIRDSSFTQNTSLTTGGAINHTSDLIISGSVFIENSAILKGGAIMQGGIYGASISVTTFISNSTDGDGGAIYHETGNLNIFESTLNSNVAEDDGGAVYIGGNADVTNSTFSQNSASNGGGIANYGNLLVTNSAITGNNAANGGGIFSDSSAYSLLIANCTIAENEATSTGGGIYLLGGTVHSINNTFSDNKSVNGGNIYVTSGSIFSIVNTILSTTIQSQNNCDGDGSIDTGEGQLTGLVNLATDDTCGLATQTTLDALKLSPVLADNGGPTQTIALQSGSIAIDTGDAIMCSNWPVSNVDQRGVTRPQGSQCDIGAYEYVYTSSYVTNTNNSGLGSLRQAIADATDGDTITFAPNLAGQTIYLTSELEVDKSITIDGSNLEPRIAVSGDTDADGSGDVQIMTIGVDGAVKISNVDFVNGKKESSQLAGGINNFGGSLELENCAFVGNTGDTGGAILNKGTLTIQNCAFQSNSAAEGGAIYNDSLSSISIEDSEFVNNTASVMGGAIENRGQLIIDGSTFNENSADGDGGGAIFTGHSTSAATITSSTFTQNTAAGENGCGGAIAAAAGNFAITDSDFIENSSSSCGGAMFAAGISTTITNSVFAHNTTGNEGGGAIWSAFEITIENSTFEFNTASVAFGGGIKHVDGNLSTINSIFSNNSAKYGGAISIGHLGFPDIIPTVSIANTLISNNHADESGGGILIFAGEATITNSTISGNTATEVGGIFILPDGVAEIRDSTINDNINEGTGEYMSYVGAVVTFGELTVENSTIANNLGSGIKSYGTTIVHHSTIAGNDSIGIEVLEDGFESTLNLVNSIIANNALDCVRMNGAGAIENISNLIETTVDGEESCGTAFITDDPHLGPLADNGGPTQTMALLPGSPAINAGTNNDCPETDQRGVTRPQGSQCDIGAYEYEIPADSTPPTVIDILMPKRRPFPAPNVDVIVKFSEPVFGVDEADFQLITDGLSGSDIVNVSGTGDTYTVSLYTGTGKGILRLKLADNDSILDAGLNPLGGVGIGNGDFMRNDPYPVIYLPFPIPFTNNAPSLTEKESLLPKETDDQTEASSADVTTTDHDTSDTQLIAPKQIQNTEHTLSKMPSFHWSASDESINYQFMLDDTADFSSPLIYEDTTDNSYTLAYASSGVYYWRVRAQDSDGNWSPWSPTNTVSFSLSLKR